MTKLHNRIEIFQYIDMQDGDVDTCWEWKGDLNTQGIPACKLKQATLIVDITVYELVTGLKVPAKTRIQHMCGNVMCLNPHHMECPQNTVK